MSEASPTGPSQGRIAELDGLRGIAVLLVMVYHQSHSWLPGGGKMGVGLFFVLSGYLITTVLVRERERTGGVRFRAFYARRARRLLPALAGFCCFWWLYANAMPAGWTELEGIAFVNASILQAATFTSNLVRLLDWDAFRYFRHAWSLAVEEQFYLVWPVLVLILLRLRRHRASAVLALTGAVCLARFWLWLRGVPYPILYDTMQWDGLLLGCALAVAPGRKLPRWTLWPALAGFVALLAIDKDHLPAFATLDFAVQAVSCAVIVHHAARWRWLAQPMLVHVGMISYGLYLWHYPFTKLLDAWLAFPLSFLAAEISHRFVEKRFYNGSSANAQPTPPAKARRDRAPLLIVNNDADASGACKLERPGTACR